MPLLEVRQQDGIELVGADGVCQSPSMTWWCVSICFAA
jgi:hypothetical protein